MSGPQIMAGRTWRVMGETLHERAFRVGKTDIRPCGCASDPGVFGHGCVPPLPKPGVNRPLWPVKYGQLSAVI